MTKNALAVMMPKPTRQETNYAVAIWLPFQSQVWMYLGISIVFAVVSLYILTRLVYRMKKIRKKQLAMVIHRKMNLTV